MHTSQKSLSLQTHFPTFIFHPFTHASKNDLSHVSQHYSFKHSSKHLLQSSCFFFPIHALTINLSPILIIIIFYKLPSDNLPHKLLNSNHSHTFPNILSDTPPTILFVTIINALFSQTFSQVTSKHASKCTLLCDAVTPYSSLKGSGCSYKHLWR